MFKKLMKASIITEFQTSFWLNIFLAVSRSAYVTDWKSSTLSVGIRWIVYNLSLGKLQTRLPMSDSLIKVGQVASISMSSILLILLLVRMMVSSFGHISAKLTSTAEILLLASIIVSNRKSLGNSSNLVISFSVRSMHSN